MNIRYFLKRHWLPVLIIALVVLYFANQSQGGGTQKIAVDGDYEENSIMRSMPQSASIAADSYYEPSEALIEAEADQKIIKTGSLSLHVDDVRDAVEDASAAVVEAGGSVLSSNVNQGTSSYSAYMSLRVPSENFETAMVSLKDMALSVESESVNADDVTEAYADLEARLTNYQAEEAQYLTILNQAGSMTEILEVTRALSDVRYQIERIQGQINYYDNRVDYSTISLSLSEDERVGSVAGKWRPSGTVQNAFSDWVAFLQEGADKLIYLAIYGWPVVLIYLAYRWTRRRRR
jgi:hypothetical protein